MSDISFPEKIQSLPPFSCRFEAFKLAADNCDVLFAVYPAGSRIEPHTHETDNWGIVTKGTMKMTIGDVPHIFNTGDWYHIPAGAEHDAACDTDTEQIEFWFKAKAT